MPRAYSDYTKQVVIYVPPPPGPQTGQYIAKIAAEGNQGNRTRNDQVLSKIYRVGVGLKERVEDRLNRMDRATERSGPWNGKERTVFRKMLSPCNTNRTDRF